ncbi:MAG: hypothetical protein AAFP69_11525 [Planctomycetota bacterium]
MNTFSLEYIDELYVRFVNDPNSVDESWRTYFKSFLIGNDTRYRNAINGNANTNVGSVSVDFHHFSLSITFLPLVQYGTDSSRRSSGRYGVLPRTALRHDRQQSPAG